jgi:hypothetical protein
MPYEDNPCAAVYRERNLLLAMLAEAVRHTDVRMQAGLLSAYRALHPVEDTAWDAEWRNLVVLDMQETGQMSWHIHDSELPNFEKLPFRADYRWDGHTTEEKYQRLLDWVAL